MASGGQPWQVRGVSPGTGIGQERCRRPRPLERASAHRRNGHCSSPRPGRPVRASDRAVCSAYMLIDLSDKMMLLSPWMEVKHAAALWPTIGTRRGLGRAGVSRRSEEMRCPKADRRFRRAAEGCGARQSRSSRMKRAADRRRARGTSDGVAAMASPAVGPESFGMPRRGRARIAPFPAMMCLSPFARIEGAPRRCR